MKKTGLDLGQIQSPRRFFSHRCLWLFLGFYWFNRKVEFSLFIAQLVTTSFAVVTQRVQILLPVWEGEPRPENSLDDLPNSGPAVRLDSEGRTTGPHEDRYRRKERIGGFWVLEATDMNEALEWGREAVVACRAPVELRQFHSL
jgi:hypothetical protein